MRKFICFALVALSVASAVGCGSRLTNLELTSESATAEPILSEPTLAESQVSEYPSEELREGEEDTTGVEKRVIVEAIEEYWGDVAHLDEIFRLIPQGSVFQVSSFFEYETRDVILTGMESLKALCNVVSEYDHIRVGSSEDNELFMAIRKGVAERVALYEEAMDNYLLFYDAFSWDFREDDYSLHYEPSDKALQLVVDGGKNSITAQKLIDHFTERARIVASMVSHEDSSMLSLENMSEEYAALSEEFIANLYFSDYDGWVLVDIFRIDWTVGSIDDEIESVLYSWD